MRIIDVDSFFKVDSFMLFFSYLMKVDFMFGISIVILIKSGFLLFMIMIEEEIFLFLEESLMYFIMGVLM